MWETWKHFNIVFQQQEEILLEQRKHSSTTPLQPVYPNPLQISLNDERPSLISQQQSSTTISTTNTLQSTFSTIKSPATLSLNESSIINNDPKIPHGVQLQNIDISANHNSAFRPYSKVVEASNEVIVISDSEDDEKTKFQICTNPHCNIKHYHGPENSFSYSIVLANDNFKQINVDSNSAHVSYQHPLVYGDPSVRTGILVLQPESHNDYSHQSVTINTGQSEVDHNKYSTLNESQNDFLYHNYKVTIEPFQMPSQPKINQDACEQTLLSPSSSSSKSNTNFDMSAPLNLSMKKPNENNEIQSTSLPSTIEIDSNNIASTPAAVVHVDILPKSIKTSVNNTNDLMFDCRAHSKTYKNKGSLELRMNIHSEQKSNKCKNSFKCSFCGNSFIRQSLLKEHLLIQHGIGLPSKTRKRIKYVCDTCGYIVTNLRGLNAHMKKEHPVKKTNA